VSDVQLENGYTRIANELLEVIYSTNFNATQLKIVLCIIRYTYGFSRISHNISISFLSKATGVSKRYISDELKKMIDNKVVTVIQEHSTTTSRILKLNKNYSQWIGYRTILQQVNNTSTGEQLITTTDEQYFTTTDEQYFIQERKKDNIKESIPLKKESKIFSNDDKEYKLSKYLSKCIAERLDKPLKDEKTLQSWAKEFNKMVRLDKYDYDEMLEVLQFSQTDDFWKKNILSAAKFRKQYLTLLAQMKG
jgi:phage replication O-like protein O